MAKSRSCGLREYRLGFFKSFIFRRHQVGPSHCPCPIQDMVPNNMSTMATRTSLDPPRESSATTWKRLFCRSKPDASGIPPSTILPSANHVSSQPSHHGHKSEGVPRLAKGFLRKANIAAKDSTKSAHTEIPPECISTRIISRPTRSDHFFTLPSRPKSRLSKSIRQTQHIDSCENTPLFRAYSQAVKYARLPAPTLSADFILRHDNRQRSNPIADGLTRLEQKSKHYLRENIDEDLVSGEMGHHYHPSHSSLHLNHVTKAEWTHKIYVLLHSGYLLQYSGTGRFDCKPEKFLQIGKHSAAFASDAIPGKLWVLQVSQAMNSDGVSAINSSSSLSRLNLRSSECRRSASSLLLVFNSSDELEVWITMLRGMINTLRDADDTQEQVRNTGLDKPLPPLKPQCEKYILPNLIKYPSPLLPFGSEFSRTVVNLANPPHDGGDDVRKLHKYHSHDILRNSYVNQSSSYSFVSQDDRRLESWCSSHHRSSYMSSGQRTMMTSQFSSPNSSPTLSAYDEVHSMESVDNLKIRPVSMATPEHPQRLSFIRNIVRDSLKSSDQYSNERLSSHHLLPNSFLTRHPHSSTIKEVSPSSEMTSSHDYEPGRPSASPPRFARRNCPHVKYHPLCPRANERQSIYQSNPSDSLKPSPPSSNTKTITLKPKHMSSEPCLSQSFDERVSALNNSQSHPTAGDPPSPTCPRNVTRAHYFYKIDGFSRESSNIRISSCSKSSLDQGMDDITPLGLSSHSQRDGSNLHPSIRSGTKSVEISPRIRRMSTHSNYTMRKSHHIAELSTCHSFSRIFSVPDLQQAYRYDEGYERNPSNDQSSEPSLSFPSLFISPPPLPPPKCALPPLPLESAARKNKPNFDMMI